MPRPERMRSCAFSVKDDPLYGLSREVRGDFLKVSIELFQEFYVRGPRYSPGSNKEDDASVQESPEKSSRGAALLLLINELKHSSMTENGTLSKSLDFSSSVVIAYDLILQNQQTNNEDTVNLALLSFSIYSYADMCPCEATGEMSAPSYTLRQNTSVLSASMVHLASSAMLLTSTPSISCMSFMPRASAQVPHAFIFPPFNTTDLIILSIL